MPRSTFTKVINSILQLASCFYNNVLFYSHQLEQTNESVKLTIDTQKQVNSL